MDDAPAHDAPRVATSTRCITCGYDLRGLDPHAVCPECATPIERSLKGTWLRYAGDDYLRTLHRGVVVILVATLIGAAMFVANIALVIAVSIAASGGSAAAQRIIGLLPVVLPFVEPAVSLLGLVGWWMLTRPDPAFTGVDQGQTPRRLVRVAVAVQAVITLINLPLALLVHFPGAIAPTSPVVLASGVGGVAAFGAWLLQFFASMLYLRWLARRIPNGKIVERAGMYMWLLPVIFLLGAACFLIGPLIAIILYALLLNDLRLDLRSILRMREATR